MNDKHTYNLESINLPRMGSTLLRLSAALMENPFTRWLIIPNLLNRAGIGHLRQMHLQDLPTFTPVHKRQSDEDAASEQDAPDLEEWLASLEEQSTPFNTIRDYARAYRTGGRLLNWWLNACFPPLPKVTARTLL